MSAKRIFPFQAAAYELGWRCALSGVPPTDNPYTAEAGDPPDAVRRRKKLRRAFDDGHAAARRMLQLRREKAAEDQRARELQESP